MSALLRYRVLAWLGAAGCAAGLLIAILFFQETLDLEPCPMCIFQRIAMAAAGVFFMMAAVHNPSGGGRWVYSGFAATAAAIGAFIAARHVWLQGLPEDQRPACGPTLEYLMQMLPLQEVVTTILKGDGNCAKIDWTLFGQSLPFWTMIAFIGFIGWALLMPKISSERSGWRSRR